MSVTARKNHVDLKRLCTLGLLVAVMMVMKALGLDNVQLTPFLKTSFLSVPVALGAMLLGPVDGAIMGAMFGAISLYDAIRGASAMTNAFFAISPIHTIILCVVTRTLMGFLTGLIFKGVRKIDRTKTICYYVGGLSAPLLNTILFMGYIILAFYNTPFIQGKVEALGAANPLMLVVLMVGFQGTLEWIVGLLVGGSVAKGVSKALGMNKSKQKK